MTNITQAQRISAAGMKMEAAEAKTASTNVMHSNTPTFKRELLWRKTLVDSLGNYAGVRYDTVRRIDEGGTLEPTEIPMDMALDSQKGFFVGQGYTSDGNTTGGLVYFRDGRSELDVDGYLRSATGAYFLGYAADANGNIAQNTGLPPGRIQINQQATFPPQATSQVDLAGNLSTTTADNGTVSSSFSIIDSRGESHQLVVTFTKDAGSPNNWTASATIDVGAGPVALALSSTAVSFNTTGQLVAPPTITLSGVTPPGAAALSFDLNLASITQYGGQTTAKIAGHDGYSEGHLQDMSVGEEGVVTGLFTNGQLRALGQLAVADFANERGLKPVSSNLFTVTPESGNPIYGTPKSSGNAGVVSRAIESSNADQADSLIKLNQASTGFSFNAQAFQKLDEMLGHLERLTR